MQFWSKIFILKRTKILFNPILWHKPLKKNFSKKNMICPFKSEVHGSIPGNNRSNSMSLIAYFFLFFHTLFYLTSYVCVLCVRPNLFNSHYIIEHTYMLVYTLDDVAQSSSTVNCASSLPITQFHMWARAKIRMFIVPLSFSIHSSRVTII